MVRCAESFVVSIDPKLMSGLNALNLLMWVAWAGVLVWLFVVLLTLYELARQRPLQPAAPSVERQTSGTPLVSILVPARNEEGRVLPACIRSILAQDYEHFEVIAVNDRSTDATAQILNAIARADDRLRVIDGAELPAGWLGKPFAMQQALAQAQGEWVLATDADMIFDKRALRTGMTYVLERQLDALTFIPRFAAQSFWERVVIPTWSWVMLMYVLFYRAANPQSSGAVGIGGFFLIRRSALRRIDDYRALKDEVMEDMRLAEMLKSSGARLAFEHAPDLVSTRMYTNFREMWECSTKNWFSGMKFSVSLAVAAILSTYMFAVAPPLGALACAVALASGGNASVWLLFIPLFLIWVMQVFIFASLNGRCGVAYRYAWLTPLGLALLYAMLLDSTVRIATGRGVTWKGRKVYERAGGVRPPRIRRSIPDSPFADE
jgi:chlorobactene glucosyltransferase